MTSGTFEVWVCVAACQAKSAIIHFPIEVARNVFSFVLFFFCSQQIIFFFSLRVNTNARLEVKQRVTRSESLSLSDHI